MRDVLTVFALMSIIFVLASLGLTQQQYRYSIVSGEAEGVGVAGQDIVPERRSIERAEWRAERDLEAQWETAFWTKVTAYAAAVGLCLTGAGIYYVKRTLELNRDFLDQTRLATIEANRGAQLAEKAMASEREIGQAQVRAYITPNAVEVSLQGRCPVIHFNLGNSGNSPAFDIQASAAMVMSMNQLPAKLENWIGGTAGTVFGTLATNYNTDLSFIHIGTCWLTDEEISDLPNAEYLFFSGFLSVSFTDVFGDRRSDRFNFMAVMAEPKDGKRVAMAPNHDYRLEDAMPRA